VRKNFSIFANEAITKRFGLIKLIAMKKFGLSLLLVLCGMAAVEAQEVKIERPQVNEVSMDVPKDYRPDDIKMKWDEQMRANLLTAIKYHNYHRAYGYATDAGQSYTLYNSQTVLPGLMALREAGGSMLFDISNRLSLGAGIYALKYDYNFGGIYNDAVMHVAADYDVAPWLTVGAYGQYAAFARRNAGNGSILMSPMVPSSAYGVRGTAMFNEVIGVQGSVGRELNPFTGKWRPVYGIAPVINVNALFK
jgi:hypothetical protein